MISAPTRRQHQLRRNAAGTDGVRSSYARICRELAPRGPRIGRGHSRTYERRTDPLYWHAAAVNSGHLMRSAARLPNAPIGCNVSGVQMHAEPISGFDGDFAFDEDGAFSISTVWPGFTCLLRAREFSVPRRKRHSSASLDKRSAFGVRWGASKRTCTTNCPKRHNDALDPRPRMPPQNSCWPSLSAA